MKRVIMSFVVLVLCIHIGYAQLPPQIPIWDANKVSHGRTLEQTVQTVKMKEFDKGYVLYDWLHFNFNIPNAYKDIKAKNGKL